VTKKSPYSLPSLSIGRHTITFKFEDEDGVEQTLAEVLIVIPRAPVFSESEDLSFDSGEDIVFSGTALPNSTVVFLISSDLVMQLVTVDSDGNWTLTIDEDLVEGNHQIVGFVRKDGYASDFSDPVTFYMGNVISSELEAGESESEFSLNLNIDWSEIFSEDNKYYFIGAGGVLLLIVLVIIGSSMKAGAVNGKDVEKFIKSNESGKKVTLREKLSTEFRKKSVEHKKKDSKKKDASSPEVAPLGGTLQGSPAQGAEPIKDEVMEKEKEKKPVESEEKEEKPVKEKDKRSVEEKPKQKKGIFSFLKFGKKKEKEEPDDVKKVVSKEEFIKDYKEDASTSSLQDETKLTKEPAKGGDKQVKKQKAKKPKDKQVDKKSKSNKIEVTLG